MPGIRGEDARFILENCGGSYCSAGKTVRRVNEYRFAAVRQNIVGIYSAK